MANYNRKWIVVFSDINDYNSFIKHIEDNKIIVHTLFIRDTYMEEHSWYEQLERYIFTTEYNKYNNSIVGYVVSNFTIKSAKDEEINSQEFMGILLDNQCKLYTNVSTSEAVELTSKGTFDSCIDKLINGVHVYVHHEFS